MVGSARVGGRGLNREECLMEKGRPGSLGQVPDAKCLIWDSTPNQSFRRHPVANKEIAPQRKQFWPRREPCLCAQLGATHQLVSSVPSDPPRLLPDPDGFLSLCDLKQVTTL